MHIAFDNPLRLAKRVHYFEYDGVRFKLIQNDPSKWSDVLLTIRNTFSDEDALPAVRAAGAFASAFSWQHDVGTSVRHIGGVGVPNSARLKTARCRSFVFPELLVRKRASGVTLERIAHIENEMQRRALAMYREAQSSNKSFLAILLNWQILDVAGTDARKWTNTVFSKRRDALSRVNSDIQHLELNGGRLGDVLEEEFRHAIAHVRRTPGRRELVFDDVRDFLRVEAASRVVRALARLYICENLGVSRRRFLVRRSTRSYPTFVDETQCQGRRLTRVR